MLSDSVLPCSMMFASDNTSGVHPQILDALVKVNEGHLQSYGVDAVTEKMNQSFAKTFGKPVFVYPVFNGTAANVLSLSACLKSYEGVIAAETSHLWLDECGAPEKWLGSKVFTVPAKNGKIKIEDIRKLLIRKGDQHYSQPKALSITQPTELGTVYSIEELKAFKSLCVEHGLYFHMDGARLPNACASMNCSLADITTNIGVDILSFGGTKNGLMNAEAIVIFNTELAKNFKFYRKQGLQLASKHRFLAAQFTEYLDSGLYLTIAKHQHSLAKRLASLLEGVSAVEIISPVESNGVFARVPKTLIGPLKDRFFFYVWDEFDNTVRWMITWDHTESDIDEFAKTIRELLKN